MARQEHTGICHICGEYKKLTYEHIPPEAAFNSQRRKMSTVKELMENKKDNRAPWDIEGLKYKQFQQGTGFIKNSKRKEKTRVVFSCRTNKFVSFFQTGYFYVLFSEYRTIRNLI